LIVPASAYATALLHSIEFHETIPGRRQRRGWVRLLNGITAAGTLSSFNTAAARAEGYVQGLVDGEQLSTRDTDRDYLIISTLTEWRAHLAANFQCSTCGSR
jgi:hypothetical protein